MNERTELVVKQVAVGASSVLEYKLKERGGSVIINNMSDVPLDFQIHAPPLTTPPQNLDEYANEDLLNELSRRMDE